MQTAVEMGNRKKKKERDGDKNHRIRKKLMKTLKLKAPLTYLYLV